MACASTVAVVVPSPAMSDVLLATSLTICAPMFSRASFSTISFATVTPSLVIVGDPNPPPNMTLRPFGPSVTLTAFARLSIPRRIPCREESPYTICFATARLLPGWLLPVFALPSRLRCRAAIDHREHFVLAQDEILHAVELDLLAGVLAEQDQIAGFDVERDALAAGADLA